MMKHKNIEELVKDYYVETKMDLNTDELIHSLKPDIANKCRTIKMKRKDYIETVTFALICTAAFLTGIFVLFPEIIDFTDTIIQFLIVGLATAFVLLGINLFVKGLLPSPLVNKNINLKGRLL